MNALILCRTRVVPTPEQIAEALCQKSYSAFVEVEGGHPTTSITAEIRYVSDKMPIVVKLYHDLYDDPDEGDYEYWDWLAELVPDAKARESIRRFIFVSAMENVDPNALQATNDYIRNSTNGMVIVQEQMDQQ